MVGNYTFNELIKQNWLQFLLVAKATAIKQQNQNSVRKLNAQELTITFMPVTSFLSMQKWPLQDL